MNRRQLTQLVLGLPFVNLLVPKPKTPMGHMGPPPGHFDGRFTTYAPPGVYVKTELPKGLAARRQEAIDMFTAGLDQCITAEQLHPAYVNREPTKLDIRILVNYGDQHRTQSNPIQLWDGPTDRMQAAISGLKTHYGDYAGKAIRKDLA